MDKQKLLQMYYEMVLIRRVEERGAELYQQGKIAVQIVTVYRGLLGGG